MASERVYALVRSTGFLTTKGGLVRDILYPKEINLKFQKDSYKFVFLMACLAILGFICTIPLMIASGQSVESLIDHSLDLITITVPPALPAAMSCGMIFAINRLKKLSIFCISPPRINVAGSVETFVFDKTGTLTEEGLSVLGFRCAQKATLQSFVGDQKTSMFVPFEKNTTSLAPLAALWWRQEDAESLRN